MDIEESIHIFIQEKSWGEARAETEAPKRSSSRKQWNQPQSMPIFLPIDKTYGRDS